MAPTNSNRTAKEQTQIAVMDTKLDYVVKAVDALTDKVDHNYVTKEELKSAIEKLDGKFSLGLKLIYGFVGLVLIAVVGAIMSAVLRKT